MNRNMVIVASRSNFANFNFLSVLEEDTYILTTDADIRFDADSVEALLDRLIRDPNVGAVCGRTHPLGHGPVVWYQMFDYAIGHWLQKVLLFINVKLWLTC